MRKYKLPILFGSRVVYELLELSTNQGVLPQSGPTALGTLKDLLVVGTTYLLLEMGKPKEIRYEIGNSTKES